MSAERIEEMLGRVRDERVAEARAAEIAEGIVGKPEPTDTTAPTETTTTSTRAEIQAVHSEPAMRAVVELVVPPPTEPLGVARRFVAENYTRGDQTTIAAHHGLFYVWHGTHWIEVEERDIRSSLYGWLEHAVYRRETAFVPFAPNRFKIANVIDALRAAEHVASDLDTPVWRGDWPPWGDDVPVAMQNGILARSGRVIYPHSPRFFNTHVLPFAFDPGAPIPTRWLRFLAELWEGDAETIETLQELIGYILCGDTRQQKIFMFVGPKRSGKGTILRVLTALLGVEHVAGPTLASLATNFGLQPLVGKPLAAISDARLGTRADTLVAVERLLSISGEDAITIDRKYKDPWTGRLPTRFMLLTNELPQFTDASGALASRFVILTFSKSFYGRENSRLTDELLEQAAGIFNWALEGYDRLQERGHLRQPASSVAAMQHLEDLASPVSAFLRDRCTLEPDATVTKDDLWQQWREWADDNGIKKGTKDLLIRDLRAAQPQIRSSRPTIDGKRVYVLTGLQLGVEATVEETPDMGDQDSAESVRSGVSGVPSIVDPTRSDAINLALVELQFAAPATTTATTSERPTPTEITFSDHAAEQATHTGHAHVIDTDHTPDTQPALLDGVGMTPGTPGFVMALDRALTIGSITEARHRELLAIDAAISRARTETVP